MRIFFILVPGLFVGWFVLDWLRQPFSDDPQMLRQWLADQPVTVVATCLSLGSLVVWAVLMALGLW